MGYNWANFNFKFCHCSMLLVLQNGENDEIKNLTGFPEIDLDWKGNENKRLNRYKKKTKNSKTLNLVRCWMDKNRHLLIWVC